MPTEKVEFDRDKLSVRIDISLKADINRISAVVQSVLALATEMKCAEGKELEIETALREALANAITHGCQCNPEKTIECCVGCDEQHGILIVVRDPGNGYDPMALANPTCGENLYSNHGRGIYLINELMDEVQVRNGGTEIYMRKK
ncbi:MAG TPA: ATP-binding protein [Terriglobales bacterium]|nr:ATP-binding protein [Terriglobales bacterium]